MQGQRTLLAIAIAAFASRNADAVIYLFFVLPVRAGAFVWISVAIAFVGFLATKDLAGLAGLWTATAVAYFRRGAPGGGPPLRRSSGEARGAAALAPRPPAPAQRPAGCRRRSRRGSRRRDSQLTFPSRNLLAARRILASSGSTVYLRQAPTRRVEGSGAARVPRGGLRSRPLETPQRSD